jgi:hydroxypyruvate isomerase
MAGLLPAGVPPARGARHLPGQSGLGAAAGRAQGVHVLIEPINTRDIPGFFLNRQDEAHAIVQAVGAPNLKVQFDLYHCQIVEGDVAMKIRQYLPTGASAHFQIAGVPERHEPDLGEVHYPYLFDVIDEVAAACGWQGWVGCEYRPARGPVAGWHARRAGLAGWTLRGRVD